MVFNFSSAAFVWLESYSRSERVLVFSSQFAHCRRVPSRYWTSSNCGKKLQQYLLVLKRMTSTNAYHVACSCHGLSAEERVNSFVIGQEIFVDLSRNLRLCCLFRPAQCAHFTVLQSQFGSAEAPPSNPNMAERTSAELRAVQSLQ